MKKFKILIPVFNDWESLKKLLNEIDKVVNGIKEIELHCVVVNDASTIKAPIMEIPKNIVSLKIINMKKNRGHARCNAFGIRYLSNDMEFDHLIVMDGDGEDRPEEIKSLIKKAQDDEKLSVVAKRIKRSEGPLFQMLYQIHKIITLIFAGQNINFGNYSCLTKNDVKILSTKESLWSSFSGSIKKHIIKFNSVNSIRGKRYFGPSKMSFFNLGVHSFSIISVFNFNVHIRSVLMVAVSYFFRNQTGYSFFLLFLFVILIFNALIFLTHFRQNKEQFVKSDENIEDIKTYTH